MSNQNITPLITLTAFSCPHCSAYTTQHWYQLVAGYYGKEEKTPTILTPEDLERFEEEVKGVSGLEKIDLEQMIKGRSERIRKELEGRPFLTTNEDSHYGYPIVQNCFLSLCYHCEEITIWVHDQIVYPNTKLNIHPNNDLPGNIRQLFEEAREIVGSSPKGAAALLRLCIQYLCKELGESGKNIDRDIGNLVKKGLDPLIQKSLDIVRVIGNESVHPGEINLNDKREIAVKLFELVNLICQQMISVPKNVQDLYGNLPQNKLEGITKRDNKARDGK